MAEHRQQYPMTSMCRVVEGSVSRDYAWSKRPPSQHSREDGQLAEHVKMALQTHRRLDGSSRLHAQLPAQGIHGARKRLARLMREQGLFAHRPRHRTIPTKREQGAQLAANLLERDFSADEPNTKWVADTTYIWTAEGCFYLAVVLDLFWRMVARLVYGRHSGCAPGHPSSAHGSRSSSTGRLTPSLRSWEDLQA